MYRVTERTQKRKDEKRQLILSAAAKVFSAKGYHDTTIRDIVKAAAVSVGSFYFYFESKEDLFNHLYKSIVQQFDDVILSVLDVENNTMLKNFTRVMTATLWMYEQKRDIARIVLLEATTANPAFQKNESDRMIEFGRIMEEWFKRFSTHKEVNIPNEHVAAFMYTGTYYSLVNGWLLSESSVPLTEYSYAFCVYNLQALRIPFEENVIKAYIEEVIDEISAQSLRNNTSFGGKGQSNG